MNSKKVALCLASWMNHVYAPLIRSAVPSKPNSSWNTVLSSARSLLVACLSRRSAGTRTLACSALHHLGILSSRQSG